MHGTLLLVSWLLLSACGGDEDAEVDADGDGYTVADGDCDDDDAAIHPGADEVCDDADNDCNGLVDDDPSDADTWYADADADGHGDPSDSTSACEPPSGYVEPGDDCDDGDPAAHPGAEEICDGADNDCDGAVDESGEPVTWYRDLDADGYGVDDDTVVQCTEPEGYALHGGDCDDADPGRNPGADEWCDGIDQNCDGVIDDDPIDGQVWYTDADHDGYGDPASGERRCDRPEGAVDDGTDCDDTRASVHPGAVEICDTLDNDCDGSVDEGATEPATWYADADHDGYGDPDTSMETCEPPEGWLLDDGDCDDGDPAIHPGAAEDCDGVDQDCDGLIDDGAPGDETWYADTDADGYGDPDATTLACAPPEGYVADATDCDDTDAGTHPGADEYCNSLDDDCDGSADEGVPVDAPRWRQDADGDTYGNEATSWRRCTKPRTWVADVEPYDCDDTDASIHPGAEDPCDGIDNDCNGVVDDGEGDPWYADTDGDGYGDPGSTTSSCSEPPGYVADATDCDDTDADTHPGADEGCADGVDNDCDGAFTPCGLTLGDAGAVFQGTAANDNLGVALAAGDFDGDGASDIVLGAEYADTARLTNAGAAYLFYGPVADGTVSASTADAILVGAASSDQAATALAGGWDVDADGFDDLLVSGKKNEAGVGTATGEAYLCFGPIASGTASLGSADVTFSGNSIYDYAGIYLSFGGDLDADGYADIVVAADSDDAYGANAGTLYVLYGPRTVDVSLSRADVAIGGETAYDYAGVPAAAGDVDGDGQDDLLVGVALQDGDGTDAGRAYLLLGSGLASGDLSGADAILGGTSGDRLGTAVAGAGDMDDDGYADVLLGAPRVDDGASDAGAVYLVYGPVSGTADAADVAGLVVLGTASGGHLGTALSGGVDTDGDGGIDLLASASAVSSSAGATYLFLSPDAGTWSDTDADATLEGEAAGDLSGASVLFAGDVAGGGLPDSVLVGATLNDGSASSAGAAYLVRGLTE